uniref:MICOS complex subunit MIC10 n=1 Tax=Hadrurus spadix TaxID=141984 RepID=A0A1W7RA65_9SCOR
MAGRGETEQGEKWDRCLADTFIKIGAGLGVGAMFSLLMFKRRMWPITLGMGIGLGMGMSNCQHDLNQPYYLRVQQLKGKQKEALVENVLIAADSKQGPAAQ